MQLKELKLKLQPFFFFFFLNAKRRDPNFREILPKIPEFKQVLYEEFYKKMLFKKKFEIKNYLLFLINASVLCILILMSTIKSW